MKIQYEELIVEQNLKCVISESDSNTYSLPSLTASMLQEVAGGIVDSIVLLGSITERDNYVVTPFLYVTPALIIVNEHLYARLFLLKC